MAGGSNYRSSFATAALTLTIKPNTTHPEDASNAVVGDYSRNIRNLVSLELNCLGVLSSSTGSKWMWKEAVSPSGSKQHSVAASGLGVQRCSDPRKFRLGVIQKTGSTSAFHRIRVCRPWTRPGLVMACSLWVQINDPNQSPEIPRQNLRPKSPAKISRLTLARGLALNRT